MITKTKDNIIQLHAVLTLFGYWFLHSFVTMATGESSRNVSIGYDAFQFLLSTYVFIICFKDIPAGRKNSFLSIYAILLFLYSYRMVMDMYGGPFYTRLQRSVFLNDIMQTVLHTFTGAWAMIASRKYLKINKIVKLTYYIGIATILCSLVAMTSGRIGFSYEDGRLSYGGGLGTLALVKIGAVEVIAAIHLLINTRKARLLYIIGIILGLWLCLASGSRGGLVGLVISLLFYSMFSSRKNVKMFVISTAFVVVFLLNLESIFIWLEDYFPIVSRRMLLTIQEHDESNRELLRQAAYQHILENPILGYSYRLRADLTGYGCHNGILDFFLALGIPLGCIFFVFVYVRGIVMAAKMMTDKMLFFPSVLAIFVFSASITSNATDGVFCFAVVLLGAVHYYYQDQLQEVNCEVTE